MQGGSRPLLSYVHHHRALCEMRWEHGGVRGSSGEAKVVFVEEGKFTSDKVERKALLVKRTAGAQSQRCESERCVCVGSKRMQQ